MTIEDELKKIMNNGAVGIKQSFEDEGALLDDVVKMRSLCSSAGAFLSVKIGGCEAISDIDSCLLIGADGIVAPMIESEFALQKFGESIISNIHIQKRKNIKFYINIETKTAYENLDDILSSPSSKLLTGIVVGRSDLAKSFGYDKEGTQSPEICAVVIDILKRSKKYDFRTLMGGNIGSSSVGFIKELYASKLLNNVETRNVIIDLDEVSADNLDNLIKSAILFESNWLEYKANYYNKIGRKYTNRSKTILDRML